MHAYEKTKKVCSSNRYRRTFWEPPGLLQNSNHAPAEPASAPASQTQQWRIMTVYTQQAQQWRLMTVYTQQAQQRRIMTVYTRLYYIFTWFIIIITIVLFDVLCWNAVMSIHHEKICNNGDVFKNIYQTVQCHENTMWYDSAWCTCTCQCTT